MIDELFASLERELVDEKLYLGAEYLDEQHAAPKIVMSPDIHAFTRGRLEAIDVSLVTGDSVSLPATNQITDGLLVSFYCYAPGPGYTGVETLWRKLYRKLIALGVTFDLENSGVRYSTDIPHAHKNRVAVLQISGLESVDYEEGSSVSLDAISKSVGDTTVVLGGENGEG